MTQLSPFPAAPEAIACLRIEISDAQFHKLSLLVTRWTGVSVPASKRSMLQARLASRLRALHLGSIDEYLAYLKSPQGKSKERGSFIDVVTTHHTTFFREKDHFEFLAQKVVPERASLGRMHVWSAACSTGEELWSLGMTLGESKLVDFSLTGMDVSHQALEVAHRGVYHRDAVLPIPQAMRKRWLMDSKDRSSALVRIVPELRGKAEFIHANLMTPELPVSGLCDVLFLRNVLIYFERADKKAVLGRLCQRVKPGGWVFLGMAESAEGFGAFLQRVAHAVYRRVA
jgi:chemotaxis protein methyltransferase CheR